MTKINKKKTLFVFLLSFGFLLLAITVSIIYMAQTKIIVLNFVNKQGKIYIDVLLLSGLLLSAYCFEKAVSINKIIKQNK